MKNVVTFFQVLSLVFLPFTAFSATEINPPVTSSSSNAFLSDSTPVDDLLGMATTSIKGSSKDRKANIVLGLKRINDKVVLPGEEFSLLSSLRPFSKEAGFKEEHVISATSSPIELGGGLCQVSTTLFRAVLQSGLSITKRQSHSYVVGYYGAGLDATVYFPGTDLRFVNNYENPITLKARLVGNIAEVSFYGKKDGRVATVGQVEITKTYPKPTPKVFYSTDIALGEKKCTEQARKGMRTNVTYTVTRSDNTATSTVFYSYYRPWAEVCYIGTTEEQKQKLEQEQAVALVGK